MEVLDDVILALRKLHQPVIAARSTARRSAAACAWPWPAISASPQQARYFRAAGINNGLTASELGLSYLLPRAIGASRAFEIDAHRPRRRRRRGRAHRAGRRGAVPEDELLSTLPTRWPGGIAAFSRPGIELTKRTLWSGLDAGSLEGHMQAEGLGQLFVRLLTANFEEAVAARADKRSPVFYRRPKYRRQVVNMRR